MTTFLGLLWAGVSLGALYSLVALGFTIVYRSSKVINFAHGALLAAGAFLVSALVEAGVSFVIAFVLGVTGTALAGLAFHLLVLRWALGRPEFTLVMLTLGFASVLQVLIETVYGDGQRKNGDPWGAEVIRIAGVTVTEVSLWSVVTALVVLSLFAAVDRYSKYGLGMRAAAEDPLAASAVGIPLRRVHALSWCAAGGLACTAGVFLGGFPYSVDPTISNVALLAFPAIIIGGLESPAGAVVGGFGIGVIQQLVQGYQPRSVPALGDDFYLIAPYLLMIVVLLVRPYGLFGTRPAERI
ncbi:branched-chain amino acid ABC transporter permease [Nocardia iowensis]